MKRTKYSLNFDNRTFSRHAKGQESTDVRFIDTLACLIIEKHSGNIEAAALEFLQKFDAPLLELIQGSGYSKHCYEEHICPLWAYGELLKDLEEDEEKVIEDLETFVILCDSTIEEYTQFLKELCEIFYKLT